jgi:Choline/Carnitine o-acyltransferase
MSRPSSRMLAYQSVLPDQPLPSAADTVKRYLASMEPILSEEEFSELKHQAQVFLNTDAFKLQLLLWFKKTFWASNYVSDWWLDYVYLRGRSSIFINSNICGMSIYGAPPTTSQAARAALATFLFMEQKQIINAERIKPLMINGIVPMCMSQYVPAFSTTREPHPEQDRLVTYEVTESRHICVIYKGYYFKLDVYDDNKGVMGKLLSPLQLEAAYKRVIEYVDSVCKTESDRPPEGNLAALTTDNRSTWSAVRTDIIQRDPTSRHGLDLIERAAFVMNLSPTEGIDGKDCTALAREFFCGDARSFWCDKSFCVNVTREGHLGMAIEHSWADAPVIGHLYDAMLANEACRDYYAEDGTIKPSPKEVERLKNGTLKIVHAERITFHVTQPLRDAMNDAWTRAKAVTADVDHVILPYPNYGKGVIKQAKCSPDAWVQMALQLAYFRTEGKFTQTYESAMSRLYRDGRTETVRSASKKSCAFVRAMEDESCDNATRIKLLREACDHHHHLTCEAMTGKGVDRHLFCLYVAAAGVGIKVPDFLNSVLGRGWKLSTSQTPAGQAVEEWKALPKHLDTHPRSGGGFGPVADDGYGVSYTFTGDNYVFFHVSSKHSCPTTGSQMFFNALEKALNDLALMFTVDDKYYRRAPSQW